MEATGYGVNTMADFKKYVESIKERHLKSDREFVLDSLTGAIDRLQKSFSRYGSFLMEFIQNSDDAKSKIIKIEISDDYVAIFNDGRPFSEEDVKSICKVGRSSKTPKEYIGYLGVGFKAVFLISDSPEIHSGNFHFKFDKKEWENEGENPEHIPWQIIPLWVDIPSIKILEDKTTAFFLPIKNPELIGKLQEEIKPEHLNSRVLLFLHNIEKIEITNKINGYQKTFSKSKVSDTNEYEIYEVDEYENGDLKYKNRWLIFRDNRKVPTEVREDYITQEWDRGDIEKREILVAFRLDENDKLIKEEKGTAHIGVFSFLPIKEVPSGLNFLIQADFLTTPGRSELARECAWNEWLAKEVYNLIVGKCIPAFLRDDMWKMNFTQILHSEEGGHELFEESIKKPLREYLKENSCLVAYDNTLVKVDECLIMNPSITKIISTDDLEQLGYSQKPLHPECKIPEHFRKWLGYTGPSYDEKNGVNDDMKKLMRLKAQKRELSFFKNFYNALFKHNIEYLKSGDSAFKYQPIILTEKWELVEANKAHIKTPDTNIPEEIEDNFNIVHSKLSTDPTVLDFLREIGIDQITEEDIKSIIDKKEISKMISEWKSYPEEEKIKKIKMLKSRWESNLIDSSKLTFITLKTKSGKWIRPTEIVFSSEYKPEMHNLEDIKEKNLLDLTIEFLSTEFLSNGNSTEISGWRRFFKELGVDNKVEAERNSIVQRVGVLLSLRYERERNRNPEALDESRKPGYDMFSESEDEKRYIEVKSSSKNDNLDIILTENEYRAYNKKEYKKYYFIYVVKNALKSPRLYILKASDVIKNEELKIIIPYKRWFYYADDEYEP